MCVALCDGERHAITLNAKIQSLSLSSMMRVYSLCDFIMDKESARTYFAILEKGNLVKDKREYIDCD